MSERKAYTLDFEEEPPKAERKGREPSIEYTGTIDAFISSGREFAKVEIPAGKKLSVAQAGLRSAIRRMGKSNEVKTITRKKKLYLIAKPYSDKRKWTWKKERKKK